jgi:hypothetical protein
VNLAIVGVSIASVLTGLGILAAGLLLRAVLRQPA